MELPGAGEPAVFGAAESAGSVKVPRPSSRTVIILRCPPSFWLSQDDKTNAAESVNSARTRPPRTHLRCANRAVNVIHTCNSYLWAHLR